MSTALRTFGSDIRSCSVSTPSSSISVETCQSVRRDIVLPSARVSRTTVSMPIRPLSTAFLTSRTAVRSASTNAALVSSTYGNPRARHSRRASSTSTPARVAMSTLVRCGTPPRIAFSSSSLEGTGPDHAPGRSDVGPLIATPGSVVFVMTAIAGGENQLVERTVDVLDAGNVVERHSCLLARVVHDQCSAAEDPVDDAPVEGHVVDAGERDVASGTGDEAVLIDQAAVRDVVRRRQPANERNHTQPDDQHHYDDSDGDAYPPLRVAVGNDRHQEAPGAAQHDQQDRRQDERLDVRSDGQNLVLTLDEQPLGQRHRSCLHVPRPRSDEHTSELQSRRHRV